MTGGVPTIGSATYQSKIDSLLQEFLSQVNSFQELATRMAGAGPLEIVAALNRMDDHQSGIGKARGLVAEAHQLQAPSRGTAQPNTLPLPHPLDAEWRFSEISARLLAQNLVDATSDGDEILLVGTPTVAAILADSTLDRAIRFVGPDDHISQQIENLFGNDPRFTSGVGQRRQAAAVLVDPPWYSGIYVQMLAICARQCRAGADLFMILPGQGTRPGIDEFNAFIRLKAERLGFTPVNGIIGQVSYRTPLFEMMALEAAGLNPSLGDWRLAECVHLAMTTVAQLADQQPSPEMRSEYLELMIQGSRARLTLGRTFDERRLAAVENNKVSRSVSARSETRKAANLWTTTNRAMRVDEQLVAAAMAVIAERDGLVLPERITHPRNHDLGREGIDGVREMIHDLDELFTRETDDAIRHLGENAWLRNAKGIKYSNA